MTSDEKAAETYAEAQANAGAIAQKRGGGRGARVRRGVNRLRFAVMSSWMPSDVAIVQGFIGEIFAEAQKRLEAKFELPASVAALKQLIDTNESIGELVTEMLHQNAIFAQLHLDFVKFGNVAQHLPIFLLGIAIIIERAPWFHLGNLVGVPLAAWLTGCDATLAGLALFRIRIWNDCFQAILQQWHDYLSDATGTSNNGFRADGVGWMTTAARADWMRDGDDMYIRDQEEIPWYNSWNSFFTRQFTDSYKASNRPVAGSNPPNPQLVTSCNDGYVFRWRDNIKREDVFWFKDMPYSIEDIFRTTDAESQAIFDEQGLVDRFTGGCIFQSFLNPYDYHRWWTCVAGRVVCARVLPGFYYSKLVIPDFDGSSTASLPYLLQTNVRGICVIDTTGFADIGYVCCVPIGMCEVSTVHFNEDIVPGAELAKGHEIGNFQFGGSSFAMIFENAANHNKVMKFQDADKVPYDQNPEQPEVQGGVGVAIWAGQQIAVIGSLASTDTKEKESNANSDQ